MRRPVNPEAPYTMTAKSDMARSIVHRCRRAARLLPVRSERDLTARQLGADEAAGEPGGAIHDDGEVGHGAQHSPSLPACRSPFAGPIGTRSDGAPARRR